MRFFLFVLASAAMFLRPAELVPELIGASTGVYEILVVACLLASFPAVLSQLAPSAVAQNPVTLCSLGVLTAIGISGLLNLETGDTVTAAVDFCKVLIYYLLLVSALDSPGRLRAFLYYLNGFILIVTTLALLQFHGLVDIPSLAACAQRQEDDEETGEAGTVLLRLVGPGIFNNPNDLARIVAIGILLSLYGLADRRVPLAARLLWLGPIGGLGYALVLTYSRGGFLALAAGLGALAAQRFGARKAIALGVMLVPLVLVAKGRQTDVSMDKGTANERIRLWRDGLHAMRTSPIVGIGPGTYQQLTGGLGAHNSFVHAYTEIGFVGGTLFLGAFGSALLLVHRLRPSRVRLADPRLEAVRPVVLALLAAYGVGMLSSARCYWVVTYMLFALATAVHGVATTDRRVPRFRLEARSACLLIAVSAVLLAGFFAWIRVLLG